MKKLKLKSTLFESKSVWVKTNRNIGCLEFFFKQRISHHLYRFKFRAWNYGIDVCINPFEPLITIQIGKREMEFTHYFLEVRFEKSKTIFTP